MLEIRLGRDEGKVTGPRPGFGASSVGGMVAVGSDMEGTPGDALPPRPGYRTSGLDASGVTHPADPGMYAIGHTALGVGHVTPWLAAVLAVALALLAVWMFSVP